MCTGCRWWRWNFPNSATGAPFPGRACCARVWAFTGEIRAVGDFLYDQINYQHRVGFDAWDVPGLHPRRFRRALTEMTNVYQPSADGRKTIRELRAAV